MSYINFDVQSAFFKALEERREKRILYGAFVHPPFLHFDKCLNMIVCHHPDIWSYGTGNFLVASKLKISTKAQSLAYEWRVQAMNQHVFYYSLKDIDDEVFGYFSRFTLEYRDRMRIFRFEAEQKKTLLGDDEIERFNYIESVVYQLEEADLAGKKAKRIGRIRYGLLFDERQMTKNQTNYQIYQKIEESMRMPISSTLREFIYPEFFVDTISISKKFVCQDQKAECVVCLDEKNVLGWPCHIMHVTCKDCSIKIIATGRISCPLCRKEF